MSPQPSRVDVSVDERSRLIHAHAKADAGKMPEGVDDGDRRRGSLSEEKKEQKRYILGLILLLGVVVLWTASNFITASLETGDDSYNKPFFITYLNTASFVIYLIPSWFKYRKPKSYESLPSTDNGDIDLPPSPRIPTQHVTESELAAEEPALPMLSVKETARIAGWWALFWFLANWSLNVSLAWTSVASVTILSSTSGFFCLALGRVYGVESFSRDKVFAAIASFIGVVLVTSSDSSLSSKAQEPIPPIIPDTPGAGIPSHPILGDIAALAGAALYSVYVVYMKVKVGDEDRADTQLLLGFAGLFCIVGLFPVIPLLHWTGLETFELPPTRSAWIICGVNMCITLSSDYLYVLALLKTAPMMVTVGLSLTIPIALLASLFIPSASASAITLTSLLGAGLVCVGFAIMGQQGYKESQEKEERRQLEVEARRTEAGRSGVEFR